MDLEKINKVLENKYGVKNPWKRFERRMKRGNQLTNKNYTRWAKRFLTWGINEEYNLEDPETLYAWDDYLTESKERIWLKNQTKGRSPGIRQKYKYSSRIIALTAGKVFMISGLKVNSNKFENVNDIAMEPRSEDDLKPSKILSEKEIEEVIESSNECINPKCEIITKLSFNLILRAADIVRMRPKDLNINDEKIHISPAKGSIERTHKLIDLPFFSKDELVDKLERLKREKRNETFLFKNSCQDRPTASSSIRVHFVNYHDQSFHEFARHSAICWFIENFGFERAYLRARHANYTMTTRYAEFTNVELSEVIE